MAVGGGTLYVTNDNTGRVCEYDATIGTLVNANFITGYSGVYGLVFVPEPGTSACLLVGVAGAGVVALHRRQAAQY